jgi:hypothetical protein
LTAVLTAENQSATKKSATFLAGSVALGVSCGRFALNRANRENGVCSAFCVALAVL